MSEQKAVGWFADNPTPNRFFFRSPFRSWKFIVNSVALATLLSVGIFFLLRNLSSVSKVCWVLFLMFQGGVYPYLRVLQSHRKINELYLAGKISAQPAESPIDELLSVADTALNDGLFFLLITVGTLVLLGLFHFLR